MAAQHAEMTFERENVRITRTGTGQAADNRPPFTLYGNPGGPLGPGGSPGPGINGAGEDSIGRINASNRIRSSPGGDAPAIRADREKFGASREKVTDRAEDWHAAEPKSSGSSSPFELRKRTAAAASGAEVGRGEGKTTTPPRSYNPSYSDLESEEPYRKYQGEEPEEGEDEHGPTRRVHVPGA